MKQEKDWSKKEYEEFRKKHEKERMNLEEKMREERERS